MGCWLLATGRLRRMRGGAAVRRHYQRHAPLRRQQLGAVIYVSVVVRALKEKRRPKTLFREVPPERCFLGPRRGVGERRRAARPGAARSWRLSAPLVTPAPERIKAGAAFLAWGAVLPRARGGLTLLAARPALSASGLSGRINVAPRRINSKKEGVRSSFSWCLSAASCLRVA